MSKPFEKFEVSSEGPYARGRIFEVYVQLGDAYPTAEAQRQFISRAIDAALSAEADNDYREKLEETRKARRERGGV